MGLWGEVYHQTCTYWPPVASDGYGGDNDLSYVGGTQLSCRWEDRSEEVINSNGELVRSHSVVWTEQLLEVGGYLFLGISNELSPLGVASAHKIRRIKDIPPLFNSGLGDEENVAFL